MNPYYKPLTREQKRRKQQIRNYRRSQQWICEWITKADECKKESERQLLRQTAAVVVMMYKHIFEDEKQNEECLHHTDMLSQNVALSVLE